MVVGAAVIGGLGWAGVATAFWLEQHSGEMMAASPFAAASPFVANVAPSSQAKLDAMRADLAEWRKRFDIAVSQLSEKQAALEAASATGRELGVRAEMLAAQVEELRRARDAAFAEQRALDRRLAATEARLAVAESQAIAAADPNAPPVPGSLEDRVSLLEAQNKRLRETQRELINRFEETAGKSLDEIETALRAVGIDADEFLELIDDDDAGRGGPYVSLREMAKLSENIDSPQLRSKVRNLSETLKRVAQMRGAIDILPLGAPVRHMRVTSNFGPRRDPLGRGRGFHEGVDLGGKLGEPIRATGDGRVSYAGWRSGYGKTVEITHPGGIVTRFGHLTRFYVKSGQQVKRGDRIAGMGSTGRSTGVHLHYEVIYKGRPRDPMKFLRLAYALSS